MPRKYTLCCPLLALRQERLALLAQLQEETVEESPVEVLAHLVEDEPVADGAALDEVLQLGDVLVVLEVPDIS